jgi:hypothetical protein
LLKVSCLSAGVITSLFAYREEMYASDAQERYRQAGPLENHHLLYTNYTDHLRMRNYLGIVSGTFFSVGIVLWFF